MTRYLLAPSILFAAVCASSCSWEEPEHRRLSFTPGRETELRGARAPVDAAPKFLGEIVFWQDARPEAAPGGKGSDWPAPAFLNSPFSTDEVARRIALGASVLSCSASLGAGGEIGLVYSRTEESRTVVETRTSRDGARSWTSPLRVDGDDEILMVNADSLAPGPGGSWYLLVRYRIGKVRPGMLLRVYRREAPERAEWEFLGGVPGSDDLSTFDVVGFDASPDGRLAAAFATYEGELRVMESVDGGKAWTDIESPKRPRVPGLGIALPGWRPTVRDGMPGIRWVLGGWGLVWEEHVSIPKGLSGFENYVDTLFARYDIGRAGWGKARRVNDRRMVASGTVNVLGQLGRSGMQVLEKLHREGRGRGLRYPHLATAPSGRLAVLWTELRDGKIVPVASVSDDGGGAWSAAIVLADEPAGDVDRVRGSLSGDGKTLRAVFLTWPGESSLRAPPEGLGLEVAEVELP